MFHTAPPGNLCVEVLLKTNYLMALAATAFSFTASAATVTCATNANTIPSDATHATAMIACPGVSAATLAGNSITSLTIFVKGSFDDSAIPPYNGQVKFRFTEQSGQLMIAPIIGDAPVGTTGDIGSTGTLSGTQNSLALLSLTGFNVDVLETLLSGGRLPANSNVTVAYDYTASAVPEPSTYAMIGLGLSALALRRRK